MPSFTFSETLRIVITSIALPALGYHYVKPYLNFKKELRDTKRILELHSHYWYNSFELPQSEHFIQKINEAKDNVRDKWSILDSTYDSIPKYMRSILIHLKKLPPREDMNFLLRELVGISNSMIIYSETNSETAKEDFEDRKNSIPKIKDVIQKYV